MNTDNLNSEESRLRS
jgi:protein farnesyltransferase subunit beta